MSRISAKAYRGARDLRRLASLARSATAARWPGTTDFHVGDVVWGLCTETPGQDACAPIEDVTLFDRDGEDIGFVWFSGPAHFRMDLRPGCDDEGGVRAALLRFAEERADCLLSAGPKRRLSTTVRASDEAQVAALRKRGFAAQRRADPRMRRNLRASSGETGENGELALPLGFRVRDCTDADLEERAAVHRDAWSHLAHLGIENARSRFTLEVYERLREAPGYDASLDLVVEAPGGTYAGCCICWADEKSGVGLFEPVGTRAAHRRKGIGRALTVAGLRRLRARGMEWALVGTAGFNDAARATYLSCGFEQLDEDVWYRKELA